MAYVVYIAPFKYALDYKIGFGIVVELLKIDIPKDSLVKYGLLSSFHVAKLVILNKTDQYKKPKSQSGI